MQIGIIGGTGGMGKWFARFLEEEGYTVYVSGRNRGMSAVEMADTCQVVVISVPISVTKEVIKSVGPYMRRDALLMDLTSLKREPVNAMLEASESEVIGCHPLFGPQVETLAGRNVVLCPARGERWLPWLLEVFRKNGASVVESTPEKHDRMMAIVQAVNHFSTVAMGLVLGKSGEDLSELMRFSTPNFQAKVELVKRVFCQNPRLYAEIVTMNPDALTFIDMYESIVAELKTLIEENGASGVANIIEEHSSFLSNLSKTVP